MYMPVFGGGIGRSPQTVLDQLAGGCRWSAPVGCSGDATAVHPEGGCSTDPASVAEEIMPAPTALRPPKGRRS